MASYLKKTAIKDFQIVIKLFIFVTLWHPTITFPDSEIVFWEDDAQFDTEGCFTPNGNEGSCMSVSNCSVLFEMIGQPDKREFLKDSVCGWDPQGEPMVCCDKESRKATLSNCTTLDNEPGQCIPLASCHPLTFTYRNMEPTIDAQYKRCGITDADICCPIDSEAINSVDDVSDPCDQCLSSAPPDPSSQCCDQETVNINRVAESQCKNANENCVSIYECKPLIELTRNPSPANTQLLQQAFCGFSGTTPMVCCPPPAAPPCITPDNTPGTCISLYSCPHLMAMLTQPIVQTALEYVQRSKCSGTDRYSVCCGSANQTPSTTLAPSPKPFTSGPNGQCILTAQPPDPSTECCGLDGSGGGNRIVGGNATAVDEYPWLAIIEYVKDNKIKLLCGGVLISGRYVMTASHCVVGPVLSVGKPVNVRLGEYDTSNTGPDCVDVAGGGMDCTEGERIVPIEKTIPHPEYNPSSKLRRHDIALIRLAQTVEYTDFIRPVCLPTADFTDAPPADVMLHVAGWGAVNDTRSSSNIKLAVTLPYVSYQDCQPSYTVPSRRVTLWDGQICAGGVVGKDSCKGDSGGPLIRLNGRLMELVGIVSFGPTPCGMENVAGVYTKVHKYLPWIRSNIED